MDPDLNAPSCGIANDSVAARASPDRGGPAARAPSTRTPIATTTVHLTRMEAGVLAGVLHQRLCVPQVSVVFEGLTPAIAAPVEDERDCDEAALARVARMLTGALERPAGVRSRVALRLTSGQAHRVRALVEEHYEEHRRTSGGMQVALGRRLERLIRTLRTEALNSARSPSAAEDRRSRHPGS